MGQLPRIVGLIFLGTLATAACDGHSAAVSGGSGGANGGSSGGGATGTGGASTGGATGTGGAGGNGGAIDPATISIPDPISESEFKALIAVLGCDAEGPCCAAAGFQYNAATCQLLLTASWNNSPPNTTFDSASAVACLKWLQAKPACGGQNPACDSIYRGTLPTGAACQSDEECAPSGNLEVNCDSTDNVCTTTSRGKLGDTCDETCLAAAEGLTLCFTVFEAKVYPVTPYAHMACDRAQGLFCDTSIRQCAALKGAGGSCTGRSDCAVGMNCVVSGTKGTCEPNPTAGQPCPSTESVILCSFDAYCGSDEVCYTLKAAGQSCTTSAECLGVCASGLCVGASRGDAFVGLVCGGQSL